MPVALKCMWTVTAGILIGESDEKFTRSYQITNVEWEPLSVDDRIGLLLARGQQANEYAAQLQVSAASGREPNWVIVGFVWM